MKSTERRPHPSWGQPPRRSTGRDRAVRAALLGVVAAALAAGALPAAIGPGGVEWRLVPLPPSAVEAVPPLPPTTLFPVQLVLDDDSAEGAVGVGGQFARQFLWFNRFTPTEGFHLREVWVLFPTGTNMVVGAPVEIAIYQDPDGDPTNGAVLLHSFNTTIQAVDDNTFSVYTVVPDVVIPAGSDALIGVIPRFIVSGVTSATSPAALDTDASQGRSWVGVWSGDPPSPPALTPPPDQSLTLVDNFLPGNWMIRGFGVPQGVTEVPALDGAGLVALAALLGGLALLLVRRRNA
jgi:hypothetical protein